MASYNVVLNLTGNAVTRAEQLAVALGTANANAVKLATSLASVGAAGRSMPRFVVPTAARPYVPSAGPSTASAAASTRHMRHSVSSFGYYTKPGRFIGRALTLLPQENGTIAGINADSLLKGVHVADIASHLVTRIGKTVLKTMAVATAAPIAIGGGGLMVAIRALQSEEFAEGARLISRRHQARLGLGADFEQAQRNADFLAASYGLDRSTTISSINTFTGLGVGGKRKLALGEATGLTKVAGLISQHHGVPFERVATNMQQLLVQTVPHVRDIREMLNQAPILGKYAIREMEAKGVQGMDIRDYLKDKGVLFSVWKQYEMDVATNAGMRARGQISLAQQDMWARIAGHDPFWSYVGTAGAGVVGSMGAGFSNLMTTLTNNDSFRIMVKQVEHMFDNLGTKGTTFIDKLISLVDLAMTKLGLDPGDKAKSAAEVQKEKTLEALGLDPYFRERVEKQAEAMGLVKIAAPALVDEKLTGPEREKAEQARKEILELRSKEISGYVDQIITYFKSNLDELDKLRFFIARDKLALAGDKGPAGETLTPYQRQVLNISAISRGVSNLPYDSDVFMTYPVTKTVRGYQSHDVDAWKQEADRFFGIFGKNALIRNPTAVWPSLGVSYSAAMQEATSGVLLPMTKMGGIDPEAIKKDLGEDLTGMNRDRRSLEIHFHDKIVEWNSTITATNPQETVDEIAENVEDVMAAGLQKALLGASNKMSSRWY